MKLKQQRPCIMVVIHYSLLFLAVFHNFHKLLIVSKLNFCHNILCGSIFSFPTEKEVAFALLNSLHIKPLRILQFYNAFVVGKESVV